MLSWPSLTENQYSSLHIKWNKSFIFRELSSWQSGYATFTIEFGYFCLPVHIGVVVFCICYYFIYFTYIFILGVMLRENREHLQKASY